jgi:hypothetical protein
MRGRRVGEGGYDGEESYGEGILFGGGRILRGGYISVGDFSLDLSWCEEFGFGGFW